MEVPSGTYRAAHWVLVALLQYAFSVHVYICILCLYIHT